MKGRTVLYTVSLLLMLNASACRTMDPAGPKVSGGQQTAASESSQTQAQMVAGIHAATDTLEAEIMMRFVHTPNQVFYENAMTIVGRTFAALPTLAPPNSDCPGGSAHICSTCEGYPPIIPCPLLMGAPGDSSSGPEQTTVQMLAGIHASVRLLDAEILTRFVHTPNQEFFVEVMEILTQTFEELPNLFPSAQPPRCPPGTAHIDSMCMGRTLFEALRTREFSVP